MVSRYDTVVIGGGPGGSTLGSLLRKHDPHHRVLILEREVFPREHVGESQLPPVSAVLHEMGAWEKVEAAGFPIKIGATYRWGQTDELWDFEFLPLAEIKDEPRPSQYEGWRSRCAFQVERAIYDEILLDHAASLGCEVREGTRVASIQREGDRVTSVTLDTGEVIEGRHYVDASGGSAILRRAMGVEVEVPNVLKNIAIWDYWENADWAVEIGTGGTRVQVLSLGYGWLWFIPLGPTRTSVGLVAPADYHIKTGKSPQELYLEACEEEPRLKALLKNGVREGTIRTTKDWSFVADRTAGENWFLVGESAGFADPILAAGLTITQVGARELAYTILALDRGSHEPSWLRSVYDEAQRTRVWQHIRFATFWYTGNGRFTELFEVTKDIAKDAGYDLDPNKAFWWFASGTFTHDSPTATLAHHSLATAKYIAQVMTNQKVNWEIAKSNRFRVDLDGAVRETHPEYRDGQIRAIDCWRRDGRVLRLSNLNELIVNVLSRQPDITEASQMIARHFQAHSRHPAELQERMFRFVEAFEALILEGWIKGEVDPKRPFLNMQTPDQPGPIIHPNRDPDPILR
jgi:flavin-dependent dehydrogenase